MEIVQSVNLNHSLNKDLALVATDTLAMSDPVNPRPVMFTTKAYTIPHLRMILCGAGFGDFVGQWFFEINCSRNVIVSDIDDLDSFAKMNLGKLWSRHKLFRKRIRRNDHVTGDEGFFGFGQTTTIYHFGYSEKIGQIVGYAYSSQVDFEPEKLTPGTFAKPDCLSVDWVPGGNHPPEDYKKHIEPNIKRMMAEQRILQLQKPFSDRIYIGGEILIHFITADGIVMYNLDRFEDYESDAEKIFK
jgi:hypothetical protein